MKKIRVLFVCVHNSARSQMAEAFLKKYGGELFEVESAGLEPGKLNPYVVEVMKEKGMDISKNETNSVMEFFNDGHEYDYVITVCDAASSDRCPIYPGMKEKISWYFGDPSSFSGDRNEILEKTRKVRDEIETKIMEWLKKLNNIDGDRYGIYKTF